MEVAVQVYCWAVGLARRGAGGVGGVGRALRGLTPGILFLAGGLLGAGALGFAIAWGIS